MNNLVWASMQDASTISRLDELVPDFIDEDDLDLLELFARKKFNDHIFQHPKSILVPIAKTARAVQIGIRISAIDGPVPIADVVGFTFAVMVSAKAWYDYLED